MRFERIRPTSVVFGVCYSGYFGHNLLLRTCHAEKCNINWFHWNRIRSSGDSWKKREDHSEMNNSRTNGDGDLKSEINCEIEMSLEVWSWNWRLRLSRDGRTKLNLHESLMTCQRKRPPVALILPPAPSTPLLTPALGQPSMQIPPSGHAPGARISSPQLI